MEKGLVSIIIPAYDCVGTLSRAVVSALRQTYKRIEIIIVDDGSTDGTSALCDQIAKDYSIVSVIHKVNGRQASARNAGLTACNGEFVLFLDSDDELQINCCERALSSMESDTDFVLYGFNVYNGNRLLRTPNPGDARFEDDNWVIFVNHVAKLMASPCNKLYRKSYITDYFDEACVHGEDAIFNYANFKKGTKVITLSDCLYNVNLDNPNSVNKSYKEGRLRDTIKNITVRDSKLAVVFSVDEKAICRLGSGINRLLGEIYMMCTIWPISHSVKELKKEMENTLAIAILNQKDSSVKKLFMPIPFLLRSHWYKTLAIYCKMLNLGNTIRKVVKR